MAHNNIKECILYFESKNEKEELKQYVLNSWKNKSEYEKDVWVPHFPKIDGYIMEKFERQYKDVQILIRMLIEFKNKNSSDNLVNDLKNSQIMNDTLNAYIDANSEKDSFYINTKESDEYDGIEFTSGDLYYSLQHVDLIVTGERVNGVWNLDVTVTDRYDFIWRKPNSKANIANDYGYIMQQIGLFTPYEIYINYDYRRE